MLANASIPDYEYSFEVVAKAVADEWYNGIGQPYVPLGEQQPGDPGRPKVNQDYVWGMTQSGNYIWFSSAGNALAQASGAIGGMGGGASESAIHVAEYAESQYPIVPEELRAFLGDWRPPQMHRYNMATGKYENVTPNDPLLESTLGLRSAGANDQIVLFAGPDLFYVGMNVFAFNAQTGSYIGSRRLLAYSNIRSWANVDGQLYTAVSRTFSTLGEGSVLRWTGTLGNPFSFMEVGRLDLEGANICAHDGRLFVSTWPLNYGSLMGVLGYRSDATAGLWMSPAIGPFGLTWFNRNSWQKVWSINEYEPDPVIAKSFGGGALESFGDYLYWGTMQVPGTGSVVLQEGYPDVNWSNVEYVSDPDYGRSTSARPLALFRGKDFDQPSGGEVELLYGDGKLWRFVEGPDPENDPGYWELVPNNMGGSDGIYGRAGFNDENNYYTWSMAVQQNPVTLQDELFVGTFDVSPIYLGNRYVSYDGDLVRVNSREWPATMGGDLWVFRDHVTPPEAASLTGYGNPLNHGARNMEATAYGLFIGSANASNLLTEPYNPPDQPLKAGGWEMIRVHVNVLDPIVLDNTAVPENSDPGTLVGMLSVSEPGTYEYALLDNAGGRFQIANGNQLQVLDGTLLDREYYIEHTVRIQATETGGQIYQRSYIITVTDVNEPPYNLRLRSGNRAPENSPAGTYIGYFSTSDPDRQDSFTYALLDDADGRYYLFDRYLLVADGTKLDYETQTSHQVLVEVTDSGGLKYQEPFTIYVDPVSEWPPDGIALDGDTVADNSPQGTLVGTLSATDPDHGETFTFALLDNAGGRFQIVGNQLQVLDGSLINHAVNPSHNVTVQVTDSGGFTYEKVLAITVIDPSKLTLAPSNVDENSPAGTLVGTFSVDASGTYTYTLLDSAGDRFTIANANELHVLLGNLLNFEADASHVVVVRATESGGDFYERSFTIHVNDVNEKPTDVALSAAAVDENSPAGTVVGLLSATDPDQVDSHSYELVNNAGGRFQIAGNQLQVANGSLLNHEADDSHVVRVKVTDSGALTHEKDFTITIRDVNENPTDAALAGNSVAEGAAAGTVVGSLSATDPDDGDSHTYALLNDAGGRFKIVGSQLQVANGSLLDFESSSSHNVTVRVTDSGGLTYDEAFTVFVTDANDAPHGISLAPNSVPENSVTGIPVGTLTASDQDAGDTHTFALLNDAGGRFQIVGNQLQVANGTLLDYESSSSHSVTVEVTDSGNLKYQQAITVNVTNVNEKPTDINLSKSDVSANSPSGTLIGTFSAVDPDYGDTHSYTLLNSAGGRFKIVGSQLQVDNASLLDQPAVHQITVQVTDALGLTHEKMFPITVTSINTLTGFDVQQGATQRSYIRYVDFFFASASGVADLVGSGRAAMTRYALTGVGAGQSISLSGRVSASGNRLRLDFGSAGLGSVGGDGYYKVALDLDGNGSLETVRYFYRLMGDVNGDRTVNALDRTLILLSLGQTGANLPADTDGNGTVNLFDWYFALFNNGKTLAAGLPLDD